MEADKKSDALQQVIVKAWTDEEFKQRLLADPMSTLAAEGASLPEGVMVKAMENTDRIFHLVLPARPTHLSDLDLDKIAAGGGGLEFAALYVRYDLPPDGFIVHEDAPVDSSN